MLKKIFFGIFLISIQLSSQEFYVNTVYSSNLNKILKLDISDTSETVQPFCPPSVITNENYTDIAIDAFNNFYYVTNAGYLYKRTTLNSNCEFLGNFGNTQINSLTSDAGNFLYAIGFSNVLYRYDTSSGTFTTLGSLPSGQYPGGDLFFYEGRLFLATTTGILEINMVDPSQSCPFMNLNIPNIYAAFAVNSETSSKAYIINFNTFPGPNSTLYEIDMVHRQIGAPIRTYAHAVFGAATNYSLTSTNSTCSPTPLAVKESSISDTYFNVINPAKDNIICQTNIERRQIISIRLFDSSGRLIKDFSNQNTLERLDVSGIENGIYLLTVGTKKGETYTKKIITNS